MFIRIKALKIILVVVVISTAVSLKFPYGTLRFDSILANDLKLLQI